MECFNFERIQFQCCAMMIEYHDIFTRGKINFAPAECLGQYFARKTGTVNRLSEFWPNIFQCANMIFVTMGHNEPDNIFFALFQPCCITILNIAGADFFFQKSHAAINDQIFPLVFINIHILADMFQTAQCHKVQFFIVFITFVFVHAAYFCRHVWCGGFNCIRHCFLFSNFYHKKTSC